MDLVIENPTSHSSAKARHGLYSEVTNGEITTSAVRPHNSDYTNLVVEYSDRRKCQVRSPPYWLSLKVPSHVDDSYERSQDYTADVTIIRLLLKQYTPQQIQLCLSANAISHVNSHAYGTTTWRYNRHVRLLGKHCCEIGTPLNFS